MAVHARNTPSNVQTGLHEAARALAIASRARPESDPMSVPDCRDLASEITAVLDGVVDVLRSAGLAAVPTSPEAHTLHAVMQQTAVAGSLARRAGGTERTITHTTRDGGNPLADLNRRHESDRVW